MITAEGYRGIQRRSRIDASRECQYLTEALESGQLRAEEFSIKELFAHTVDDGRALLEEFNPRYNNQINILEAGDAVSTAQFANITGQIVFSKVMQAFNLEDFIFSREVTTTPTSLSGERIPGIGGIGDEAVIVGEGELYQPVGISEDYYDTPATVKRGLVINVTKEALFFDRTNLVLQRAADVGNWLGLNKEKRIIDAIVDENVTTHRYKWRGTSYATYQTSTPWINSKTSNGLVDWVNIDAVEQLFANMLDPNTGEPIIVNAGAIIVNPQLRASAARIVDATGIRYNVGGYATSGNLSTTMAGNPVGNANNPYTGNYRVISSRLMPTRTATDTSWFMADLKRLVTYFENWPITVQQSRENSEADFTRDIVARFKASERGAAAVTEPRAAVKSSA